MSTSADAKDCSDKSTQRQNIAGEGYMAVAKKFYEGTLGPMSTVPVQAPRAKGE